MEEWCGPVGIYRSFLINASRFIIWFQHTLIYKIRARKVRSTSHNFLHDSFQQVNWCVCNLISSRYKFEKSTCLCRVVPSMSCVLILQYTLTVSSKKSKIISFACSFLKILLWLLHDLHWHQIDRLYWFCTIIKYLLLM